MSVSALQRGDGEGEFETKLKEKKKPTKSEAVTMKLEYLGVNMVKKKKKKKHCLRQLMYFKFMKDQLVIMAEPSGLMVPQRDIR